MRGLGYGYYERQKVDLVSDPAWAILLREHRDLEGVDLARFTFELDEAVEGNPRPGGYGIRGGASAGAAPG